MERVILDHAGSHGELYLHGATLTAWQPRGHRPVLWISKQAVFQQDKPIRGGVPICFPWFGPKSGDVQHGWARTSTWTLVEAKDARAVLSLVRDGWSLRYSVLAGEKLELDLSVTNVGEVPAEFEAALHAYFAVSDVQNVLVHGLEPYPIAIAGEIDHLYEGTVSPIEIEDPGWSRRITMLKDGSNSTVLWNPHAAKAKALVDFGDDEWKQMICIEPANARSDAITLRPGETHLMRVRVVVNLKS
jgi:glucose-6-phosphate 1-epimerase